MFSSLFELFSAVVVISDFVPYLSFVTKLQGHVTKFAKVVDFSEKLTEKIFDLDSHRERYKERKNDPSYVPDLEDVLLETPLDDGRHLPDKDLLKILQVHYSTTRVSKLENTAGVGTYTLLFGLCCCRRC